MNTPAVESLTSYFCRLAHSHALTATQLAAWMLRREGQPIPADFKWCQRNFASLSPESECWAGWLSELTAVGELDRLTLVPWRDLVSAQGLAARTDRWCPVCLSADLASGIEPYLRLAWDIAPVTVCLAHRMTLVSTCCHCGRRNVRNRATAVVPGYCTACGGFLGDASGGPATPEALWAARQVGLMLAKSPLLDGGEVTERLTDIIAKMGGGQIATFARRLGLSKSGVWHWLRKSGLPSINAWLAISLYGGVGLDRLFGESLGDWEPPLGQKQLPMDFLDAPRKGIQSRRLDWDELRAALRALLELPDPITLAEACERVGIDCHQAYLRANAEARALVSRFERRRQETLARRKSALRLYLSETLTQRRQAGYVGMSARDALEHLEGELRGVRNSFELIREVREEADR
jgi:hypothetical protein